MLNASNKPVNPASLSNKDLSQSNITFGETDPDTFGESQGPFSTPYGINNKAVNPASLTNKELT